MKYLRKSFTVPACSPNVTDEDWEAIFGPKKTPTEAPSGRPQRIYSGLKEQDILTESTYQGLEEMCQKTGVKDTATARKQLEEQTRAFLAEEYASVEKALRDGGAR